RRAVSEKSLWTGIRSIDLDERTTMASTKSGFTAEERAAMKDRAKELKASQQLEDLAKDQAEKISALNAAEKKMANQIGDIVAQHAPGLNPKTYYGMPGWANAEGKVVVFFQPGAKFDTRYSTLGFQEYANLDEGTMWPSSWALTQIT